MISLRHGDAATKLNDIQTDTIDLIVTDPPYGYSFMNKDWDKAVIGVDIWKECLRVLKPGAFAFIMSSPRQDVLCKMILNLIDSGFETNFTSIYWTYASGFPKAADISKLVDKRNGTTPEQSQSFAAYIKKKRIDLGIGLTQIDNFVCDGTTNYSWFEGRPAGQRLPRLSEYEKLKDILKLDNRFDELIGEAEREIISQEKCGKTAMMGGLNQRETNEGLYNITKPGTPQAQKLEGSYAGFQPKPAVEVILVCMKPLSEKSFTDQALANGKGITWLDDCRIPFHSENDKENSERPNCNGIGYKGGYHDFVGTNRLSNQKGRFPANLLVSDDVLNDGKNYKNSRGGNSSNVVSRNSMFADQIRPHGFEKYSKADGVKCGYNDSGSYSRYFDLDSWSRVNLPWLSDISNENNKVNTFSALLVWFADHIQNKQLSSLGKNLCDVLHVQIDVLCSDTTLLGNKLRTNLGHDVAVLDDMLCKLLPQSVHNSLRKNLPANVVFDVQNVSSQLSSLVDCQFYPRLHDELLGCVANLSQEFLLLLICVAEQIHVYLTAENQDDKHEYTYHQMLSYSYVITCYKLLSIPDSSTSDLKKWFDTTFPFLITPKASKSEKNKGLDQWIPSTINDGRQTPIDNPFQRGETLRINNHPTVKPIKLMSYLITLGSRKGDIILDPFCGSGTTGLVALKNARNFIGIELNPDYIKIAEKRLNPYRNNCLIVV